VRRLSRRDLIREGGALAALLAVGAGAPETAPAAASAALTPRRRAVYAALMRALQTAPDTGLRHVDAAAAARDFAAWYARQEPAIRLHVDAVVDHLDALGLAAEGPGAGLRRLRALSAAGDGSPTPDEAVHCAMVACAMSLAGAAA
jgi:hypothetical protein